MSGSAWSRNHQPRGTSAQPSFLIRPTTRSPARVKKAHAFLLTKTYMDGGQPTGTSGFAACGGPWQFRHLVSHGVDWFTGWPVVVCGKVDGRLK